MTMFNSFPYSNIHELNLDWLLKEMNELIGKMDLTNKNFDELKDYVTNYFSSLDVDEAIEKEIQKLIDDGTIGNLINQTLFEQLNNEIANTQGEIDNLLKTYPIGEDGIVITVGKHKCMFNSLQSACEKIKEMRDAGNENSFTILIFQGTFNNEILDLRGFRKCAFIGVQKGLVNIRNSTAQYPNATLFINGTNLFFKNISFYNDSPANNNSYALHIENGATNARTSIIFSDCSFYSTANSAAGIGFGTNTTLRFEHCYFNSTRDNAQGFYCHNSQTSNTLNQNLFMNDCEFYGTGAGLYLFDACNTYGGSNSVLNMEIVNCRSQALHPFKMQVQETNIVTYYPKGYKNLALTSTSINPAMTGIDYNLCQVKLEGFIPKMESGSWGGHYYNFTFENAKGYDWVIASAIAGDGTTITNKCSVSATGDNFVTILDTSTNGVGGVTNLSVMGNKK